MTLFPPTQRPGTNRVLASPRVRLAWITALLAAVLVYAAGLFAQPRAAPVGGEPREPDAPPCSDAVVAWVQAAGRDVGVATTAVACQSNLVRVRLAPAGSGAMDVEVAEPPGPAFRMAGRFRVSPILETSDYGALPAPERAAFDRFAAWIAGHPERVAFGGANVPRVLQRAIREGSSPARGPWLVVVAVACLAFALARDRGIARDDAAVAGALFVVALALRLALGAWGPLHVNGQGALWLRGAIQDPRALANYGPGYAELFGPIAHLWRRAPDLALFATNGSLSAAIPALAYAAGLLAGLDRRRALLAGALLTVDPVSVRIATTESYVVPIAALTAAAAVALLAGVRATVARRWGLAAGYAAGAALLCAGAVRIHPVAWLAVLIVPTAVACSGEALLLRRRASLTVAAALVLGAAVVALSGGAIAATYGAIASGALAPPEPLRWRGAMAWVLAFAAAAAVLARPRWILATALAHLAVVSLTRSNYALSAISTHSFDRVYAVFPALLLAAMVPAGWLARRRAAPLVIAAAALGWTLVGLRDVPAATTDALEYRWIRRWIATMPSDCRLVYVAVAGRRTLPLPTYVPGDRPASSAVAIDSRERFDAAGLFARPGCLFYARTSLCSSREGRAVCEDVERQLAGEAVARAAFPAVPSAVGLSYDRAPVETVVFRVRGSANAGESSISGAR